MPGISAAELVRRLATVDLIAATRVVVSDNREVLADLNRKQLLEGVDSSGKKMRKYASDAYSRYKYELNREAGYGIRDQNLTGAFSKSIEAEAGSDAAVFNATDGKTPYILKRDGEQVLGLSPASIATVRKNILRPSLLQYLRQKLFSKTAST